MVAAAKAVGLVFSKRCVRGGQNAHLLIYCVTETDSLHLSHFASDDRTISGANQIASHLPLHTYDWQMQSKDGQHKYSLVNPHI